MSKGKAMVIFKNIYGDEETEEKITAIQEVVDMETHNSITKADMLEVLRWLVEEYMQLQ